MICKLKNGINIQSEYAYIKKTLESEENTLKCGDLWLEYLQMWHICCFSDLDEK